MTRFRNDQLRSGNQALTLDLDPGFVGVNNKLDPSVLRTAHAYSQVNEAILGPGTLADARNVRLTDGIARTRPGFRATLHLNQPWWTGAVAGDYEVLGSGVFSDPDGVEWLMLAVIVGGSTSQVLAVRDNSSYRTLPLGAGQTFVSGSRVDLVQGFDGMLCFRGDGVGSEDEQTPLAWAGDWIAGAFDEVAQTNNGSFDAPIPNASTATTMANRLFCASGRDTVAVSDILEYTRWDAALNEFRINEGSDDRIVALVPWRNSNLLVLMEQSTHVITGVSGDLSGAAVQTVHRSLGCVGPRAWAYVGGDVAFLSQSGIYRVSEIFENSNQVAEVPMSDPVDGTLRRVNPAAIHRACAILDGTLVRWALPIDGASECNCLLTFDTAAGTWQGIDTWTERSDDVPAFRIDRLHRVDYLPSDVGTSGQRGAGGKLAVAVHLGTKPEVVALDVPGAIADDFHWTSGTTSAATYRTTGGEILTEIQTRGYVFSELGIKQCRSVRLMLETLDATWTVLSLTDGWNEQTTLKSGRTHDRSRYVKWGQTDYVVTNTNDDFDVPYRQDYAVKLPFYTRSKGVILDVMQAHQDAYTVRSQDRWTGFRLICTAGRIALKAIEAEALMTGPHSRATL